MRSSSKCPQKVGSVLWHQRPRQRWACALRCGGPGGGSEMQQRGLQLRPHYVPLSPVEVDAGTGEGQKRMAAAV